MTQKDFSARLERAYGSVPHDLRPTVGVVLGSGLSGVAQGASYREIPYGEIAGFPLPTVAGHAGLMYLSDKAVLLAGRFHFYEGRSFEDIVMPIFLLKKMGVKKIVLTNAAGGVNTAYQPGDLVLIKDHLNLQGTNPFIGPNPIDAEGAELGPRFFDQSDSWTPALRQVAQAVARELLNRDLSEGVYAALSGPAYETPAEINMLRLLGADLVGMSTVPEALAARYLGLEILGISCVTNMAAGILPQPLNHAEVMATGKRVEGDMKRLIQGIVARL
jgi:purine-nucleoside phosphorylase